MIILRVAYLLLFFAFPIVSAVDHNAQVIDTTSKEYSDKEIISGIDNALENALALPRNIKSFTGDAEDIEADIELDRVRNNESLTTLDSSSINGSSTQDAVSSTLAKEATTHSTTEESTQFTDASKQDYTEQEMTSGVKERSTTLNPSTMTDVMGSSTMLSTAEESKTLAPTGREFMRSTAVVEDFPILDLESTPAMSTESSAASITLESEAAFENFSVTWTSTLPSATKDFITKKSMSSSAKKLIVVPSEFQDPSTTVSTIQEMSSLDPGIPPLTSKKPKITAIGSATLELTAATDFKRSSSQDAVSAMDAATLPTTVESTTSALNTQEPTTLTSGTKGSSILGLVSIQSTISDTTKMIDAVTLESVTVEATTLSSTESAAKAPSRSFPKPSTPPEAPGVTDGFTKGRINSTTPASEGDIVDQQKNVGVETISDPAGQENHRTLFIIGFIICLLITIVAVIFLALVATGKICAPPAAEKTEEI
ncbi:hypothetical protein L596_017778 [Steinernema carpocapsae]|uniref:SEA domain-containing protein n=1 Tax=Steinernema carpocapsae TaxID=34508 RepID=A0A4U5N2M4_STECR|nr:hypothetical protein L596_017778 [Steinernema carpocapsae]